MKSILKTRCPLIVIRAHGHQTTLMTFKHHACKTYRCYYFRLCQFMQTFLWNFAIFVFLPSFSEDYGVQVFFLHSILNEVCSERKQDFTLTVSLSLYWSHHIYIFQLFLFFYHTSFGCGDIDANTMCLFISLSRAWKTLLFQEKKRIPAKGQLWHEYVGAWKYYPTIHSWPISKMLPKEALKGCIFLYWLLHQYKICLVCALTVFFWARKIE